MTRDGFGRVVTLLEGAYGRDLTVKAKDAFWEILEGLNDDEAMAAAKKHTTTSADRYRMPTPAHLLDAHYALSREAAVVRARREQSEEPPLSREQARAAVARIGRMLGEHRPGRAASRVPATGPERADRTCSIGG